MNSKDQKEATWVPLKLVTRQTSKIAIERAFDQSLKLKQQQAQMSVDAQERGQSNPAGGLALPAIGSAGARGPKSKSITARNDKKMKVS